MTQTATNTFAGKMDTDSDIRTISSNDFISALNLHNGKGTTVGGAGATNVLGNSQIAYPILPTGTNKCIGAFEDAVENTIIYHIYNALGNHTMWRYWSAEGRTDLLASGAELAYTEWNYIHSSFIVDKTYYYWTDARETETGLVGNEPRKINVKKANNYQKLFEYEWHFALDDQFDYTGLTGTNFLVNSNGIAFGNLNTRKEAIQQVYNELTSEGYFVRTINNTLIFSSNVNNTVITTTAAATWARIVPYNFYGIGDTKANHISLAKPMPSYAPTLTYITDTNGINNRAYTQYCIRYIYDDNEKSAWGTLSLTPYNKITAGYKTLVDFYDEKLNSVEWLTIIKRVEIGIKYGNAQAVRSVIVLDTSEIGFVSGTKDILASVVTSNHYTHTDSTMGAIVGSDDNVSDNNTQALKPYDNIPQLTHTICLISDENGSSLATMSNNVDSRDNIRTICSTTITEVAIYQSGVTPTTLIDPLPYDVTLKPYGEYNWGIVYYDKYGKFNAVQRSGNFFTTDKLLQVEVRFRIEHLPPSWATHYQIVRQKEVRAQSYKYYIGGTISVDDIDKVTRWKVLNYDFFSDLPTATTGATIYFDSKLKTDFDLVSEGDRIRVWVNLINGQQSFSIIDEKIIGYQINAIGEWSILTRKVSRDEFSGALEVYTPKTVKDEFYYETGLKMPIVGGFHYGNDQTQTSSLPAIVKMIGGDTKWNIEKIVATANPSGDIKFINFSKKYYPVTKNEIDNEDIGRLNIIDPNAKQQWYRSEIRFSERYNLHSYYNGLSAFRGLDYLETSDLFGSIQRVVNIQSGILIVCLYKIQPVYVNRDRLLDFNANQSIGRTSRILNIAEKTLLNSGTRNPESILVRDSYIYGFDAYNGTTWRYAQDGQTPLSENMNHNLFKAIGKERMDIQRITDKVISGYDSDFETIYMSFSPSFRSAFTIGYEDMTEGKGFKGYYSFIPEQFAQVNSNFFSFKNGVMWKHNNNPVRCNFYGVQYGHNIVCSVNEAPKAVKTPLTFLLQAKTLYIVPLIEVPPSSEYPTGQKSRIKAAFWKRKQGQYYANALRDYTDPRKRFDDIANVALRETTALNEGRDLKFEAMTVKVEAQDPSIENIIYRMDTVFYLSQNTEA